MGNNIDNVSEKSEEGIIKALRGEDPEEIDLAMRTLESEYGSQIKNYALKMVRWHRWVKPDDIVQEAFVGFYKYVRGKEVKKGVRPLLMSIAHNKCVDALKRQERERKFENNISLPEQMGTEEYIERMELNQFVGQLPFTSPLSDCQRVILVMRGLFLYSPLVVARLMGKSRGTIDTHLSDANKRVKEYLNSEDYKLDLASQKWPSAASYAVTQKPKLIVERFANLITPQFTPEELKPLGLTVEEFQANYVASILLPWEPQEKGKPGYLSMVLTRRQDLESMQAMLKQLSRARTEPDLLSPEECLLKVDIDNDNIVLTVEQMLEFLPEPKEWIGSGLSDNTYMLVHSPRRAIPVTLGFFDRSLITPELYERWPFLPDDIGL